MVSDVIVGTEPKNFTSALTIELVKTTLITPGEWEIDVTSLTCGWMLNWVEDHGRTDVNYKVTTQARPKASTIALLSSSGVT